MQILSHLMACSISLRKKAYNNPIVAMKKEETEKYILFILILLMSTLSSCASEQKSNDIPGLVSRAIVAEVREKNQQTINLDEMYIFGKYTPNSLMCDFFKSTNRKCKSNLCEFIELSNEDCTNKFPHIVDEDNFSSMIFMKEGKIAHAEPYQNLGGNFADFIMPITPDKAEFVVEDTNIITRSGNSVLLLVPAESVGPVSEAMRVKVREEGKK